MSILDQFRDTRLRRQFLAFVCVLSIALGAGLVGLSYWATDPDLTPNEDRGLLTALNASQLVAASLVGGALTAGFFVFMFKYLYRPEERLSALEILDSRQTKERHEAALATTDFWYHNGHVGRWVRTEALPVLTDNAIRTSRPHIVAFIILDPRNDQLCNRFADYRTENRESEEDISDPVDIKIQLLATVVRAGDAMRQRFMTVKVYFKDKIGWSRLDATSTVAFRTLPGPGNVATAYVRQPNLNDNTEYDSAMSSFDEIFVTDDEFDINPSALPKRLSDLNIDHLKSFLVDNNLNSIIPEPKLPELLRVAKSNFHPHKR